MEASIPRPKGKARSQIKGAPTEADAPDSVVGVSMPLTTNVPCTPHRAPADVAAGGSRLAVTVDVVHTRAACFADLRDHAVRLMKGCGRHGLRRCCDDQNKGNSDQPDHSFLLVNLQDLKPA